MGLFFYCYFRRVLLSWDCFFSQFFYIFNVALIVFFYCLFSCFVAQTFSSLLVVCSFFLTYECFTMFFLWFLMRKPRALFTAESCGFLFLQCSVFFNVIFMLVMLVMFVPLYTPAKHPCWEIMVDYRTYMCPLPGGQRQHHLLAHQGGPGRAGPVPEQR